MTGINEFPLLAMHNRKLVEQSKNAGCFNCLKIFDVKEIKNYTDAEKTVICPFCEIDSVIGDMCGIPLSEETLKRANLFWFKPK